MNVLGIIFASDATMGSLTEKRTMASLPFGGRYRQVDFHLSNMTAAGISDGECLRQFRQNTPRCSEADVLIFERELEHIRNARQLFRTTAMRYWSCAIPFNYREMCCGICFYGSAPENCSREKFDLECSLLVSRIAAAVSEE